MNTFDPTSKTSIIEFAKKLKGKTLRDVCGEEIEEHGYKGKGGFGQMLEKFYFGYDLNSNAEADFKDAGLELKSSSLLQLKKGGFSAKERISLGMMDFLEVYKEEFETSSFWEKNAHLILVFYLYDKNIKSIDRLIKLVDDWDYPIEDRQVIRRDWELINQKIKDGKAHELSESDTFYLGACTKGSGKNKPQPFNDKLAKERAYSLKQTYVNHIVASISGAETSNYGKIIKQPEVLSNISLENFIISKFKPFYGQSIEEIQKSLGVKLNRKSKKFTASLTNAILNSILGVEVNKKIEEFEKANIEVKAIRLKPNGLPKEDISFPAFEYCKIVKADWEDSEFKNILERKFFFVFFQIDGDKLLLNKVKFWNMSHSDILTASEVWYKTVEIVKKGEILKKVPELGKPRSTYFPKVRNEISHVRTHATTINHTYELPTPDKLTGVTEYTRHSFWLNGIYVKDEIYNK